MDIKCMENYGRFIPSKSALNNWFSEVKTLEIYTAFNAAYINSLQGPLNLLYSD